VLVVRRLISLKGVHYATEVDIRGKHLGDILTEMYKDAAAMRLNENPPVVSMAKCECEGKDPLILGYQGRC
jgi:hypothetical protein